VRDQREEGGGRAKSRSLKANPRTVAAEKGGKPKRSGGGGVGGGGFGGGGLGGVWFGVVVLFRVCANQARG